jgi:hypothetical protein
VPEKFKTLHFTRAPAGDLPPEFARRMLELSGGRRA